MFLYLDISPTVHRYDYAFLLNRNQPKMLSDMLAMYFRPSSLATEENIELEKDLRLQSLTSSESQASLQVILLITVQWDKNV